MTRSNIVIVSIFIAIVIGGIFYGGEGARVSPEILTWLKEWFLTPERLTAWLSAFAAIVALILAGRGERRKTRLELRGIAVAVYPEIVMLKATVQTVRERLGDLVESARRQVGQSIAAQMQLIAHIQIPPMLDRNTDRLFILGDLAGPSCIHLVRLITQYNTTVENLASHMMVLNAEQSAEALSQLEQHLDLLDKVIDTCEHHVRPVHDSVG